MRELRAESQHTGASQGALSGQSKCGAQSWCVELDPAYGLALSHSSDPQGQKHDYHRVRPIHKE